MQEVWKPVKGYEGLYEVSNLGRVKSFPRKGNFHKYPVLLTIHTYKTGYKYVVLSKNGVSTKKKIYRLVAEAFIPNPDNLPQVNHKDENKSNNKVENLEWCTQTYNNQYSKAKKVIQYNRNGEIIKVWSSTREIERVLGIDHTTISYKCRNKNNKEWRYADEQN